MVSELADQAGFSLFHYYRLFQQSTGLPVMQYILRRRLLHGIYAIKQGSSMIDASLRYGFDTYAGFYKAFCREFGATPSAFLESGRVRGLTPWIGFVFTEPVYRGHRYAGQLLTHAEKCAHKLGYSKIYICTDHVGLYEKYGYLYQENRISLEVYCRKYSL